MASVCVLLRRVLFARSLLTMAICSVTLNDVTRDVEALQEQENSNS